jgi:transcriptional regulator with XRE-family HTH domain
MIVTGINKNLTMLPGVGSEHICAYPARVEWTRAEIRRRRELKGLSQAELARRLNLSRRAITNWETGSSEPRGANLRALERELGDAPTPAIALADASDIELLGELARRLATAQRTHASSDGPPERFKWSTADAPTARRNKEMGHQAEQDAQEL